MKRTINSTVARLVTAVFVLQLASSASTIYLLRDRMNGVVLADRTRELLDVRDDLMDAFYDGGRQELDQMITSHRGSAADPLIFIAVTGKDGTLFSNIASVPAPVPMDHPGPVSVISAPGAAPGNGLAIASLLPDGGKLVVGALTGADRSFDLAFAEAMGLTVTLAVVLALISALGLGVVISRRTHAIAETAGALAAGNFAARLPHEQSGDGFDHLRREMNHMAERIDQLVRQLHSVSGALAHDLQSPVARLRAAIETALAHCADAPAIEALQAARTDAEALQSMLSTALELGRLESGTVADRREMIDLGEVAADLVELYEPLAEQSGVELLAHTEAVNALADRELLSRALANLIDNALKYGGSRITVEVAATPGWAEIRVADNGPGIAGNDRERAMQRFTRLDNARTRPGAGLGLAMVSAVAQLHGGRLELSGDSGLVATLILPR